VCALLVFWMRRSPASNKLANSSYAMIIGGALGNLFDRMYHGFVVDFLDFYVGNYHWPAFNIADTAICIGAGLIIIEGLIDDKKKQPVKH
ncbi:signal peptidase II, partial [Vibrio natriegens]